jgi:hypothetical protein
MRVAYLTTDEVNEQVAYALAGASGATVLLYPLGPRDAVPADNFDAVVFDWDGLPGPCRREVLGRLLSSEGPRAVAIHGYSLGERQTRALRRRGVGVYRRLDPALLGGLGEAFRPRSAGRTEEASLAKGNRVRALV